MGVVAELGREDRDAIADACDAAYEFGDAWVRSIQSGLEDMLLPVIAQIADRRAAEARERVKVLLDYWETALGENRCPSCYASPEHDCDHGEGYHHALSDLRAALGEAS